MLKMIRGLAIALLFLSLYSSVGSLLAQDSVVTDDEVNEVAKEVYCPVCESTPLDVCATQACADWRELIRTKLAEGQSKEEIFEYFGRQYGEGVLANPPSRGVSLIMLWVLPVVLLLLAALFFSRFMRNLRAKPEAVPVESPIEPRVETVAVVSTVERPDKDDYLSRIEEEVGESK